MTEDPASIPNTEEPTVVDDESRSRFGEWLPTRAQMEKAARLRIELPPDPEDEDAMIAADSVLYASMRQGMGMIGLAGLVAGLIPFLYNWITSTRAGTVVPFAKVSQAAGSFDNFESTGVFTTLAHALQLLAGLEPSVFPGWMAAGLISVGLWLNTPLQWLTWWIVYGLAVLLIAKLLGAPTTLQQFYTVTSFGCLPLMLTGLSVIPFLGQLISLAAIVWAIAVYVTAVRSVTRLSMGMSILCTILPGAIVALIGMVFAIAMTATVIGALL